MSAKTPDAAVTVLSSDAPVETIELGDLKAGTTLIVTSFLKE